MTGRHQWTAVVVLLLCCSACGEDLGARDASSSEPPSVLPSTPSEAETSTPAQMADPVLMPDLVGLPDAVAGGRIGELEGQAELGLWSHWRDKLVTDCASRPRTVIAQEPSVGTPLRRRTEIQVWSARLDLERFRGPCRPEGGELGPVVGADADLAREFYTFAADPSRGNPFVAGEVWNGVEAGPIAETLEAVERPNLAAWQLEGAYGDWVGPFSALDVVAGSGGYYELHRGIVPSCPGGYDKAPPELVGLRAVTITVPSDTVTACLEWWGVTLYLSDGLVRGVSLRLGSP